MKTLIHSSPLGALSVAGVDGDIEPGAPFLLDDAAAELLLEQSDLFSVLGTKLEDLTLPELKAAAAELELTVAGKTKADYIEAIEAADLPVLIPSDESTQGETE